MGMELIMAWLLIFSKCISAQVGMIYKIRPNIHSKTKLIWTILSNRQLNNVKIQTVAADLWEIRLKSLKKLLDFSADRKNINICIKCSKYRLLAQIHAWSTTRQLCHWWCFVINEYYRLPTVNKSDVLIMLGFKVWSDLVICQSDNLFGLKIKSDLFFQVTQYFPT